MDLGRGLTGRSRRAGSLTLVALGLLALALLAPSGAAAAKTKLKVKVATKSQTQVLNQGVLKVSYDAKGLNSLSATAKATPDGGSQVNFAAKASKNNPKSGTLSLPLTDDGTAAVEDCVSLTVNVSAKGKPKKSDKAKAVLAEDDPECAKPVKELDTATRAAYPTGIDVGADGALWFAQMGNGDRTVGRMTTDGQYSDFHIPVPEGAAPGDFAGHTVNDLAAGPDADGGIWVTPDGIGNVNVVRRVDPATGEVSESLLPFSPGIGSKIAVGPDDAMWVSTGTASLLRVSTGGDVTEFPLSDPANPDIFPAPYGVAPGGDGAVWFTTPAANQGGGTAAVGRLDPATGETQLFPLADPTEGMAFMTEDAAGRLWFTTPVGNTIGRIDPSSGQIVEFQIPTPDSKPIGITFADDGSLWFTEQKSDNIGRYDPASGQFTEYPLEARGSLPFDIVQGPDGKIYFTEMGTGKIGQIDPNKAPAGDPNPSDGTSMYGFAEEGRCPPGAFLCQQQVNLKGSTFKINTALTQELPAETLTLTAGVDFTNPNGLTPPLSGPMLESKPLDVTVAGQEAITRIGLAGPPVLHGIIPLSVTVPIDLYVSQPGNPAGGCVIGPIVQDLEAVNDEEGDPGSPLAGDGLMALNPGNGAIVGTGTLFTDTFAVPEARGCGALTDIINSVLSLPSDTGNETKLPFTQLLTATG